MSLERPVRRVGDPGDISAPPRQRVHLRFEPERLGKSSPRLIQIAIKTERPREPKMDEPKARILSARLPQEVDRLIDMAQNEMTHT